MPLGPSEVFISEATVRAAMMFICSHSRTYLVGFQALDTLLLLLLSQNDKRSA